MNYWHLVIITAAAILFAILLYVAWRWRKAPKVFKAMHFVMAASLAAGVLLGFWSLHMLDTRIGSAAGEAKSTAGAGAGARGATPKPRGAAPAVSPARSKAARATPAPAGGGIPASYVAQALLETDSSLVGPVGSGGWPKVSEGCQLGNYTRGSRLCRAARLAVQGWGDKRLAAFAEVTEFCKAGYLPDSPALCWEAQHGRAEYPAGSTAAGRTPGGGANGIPEADVAKELRYVPNDLSGPGGDLEDWSEVKSPCARGTFAVASPICRAAAIHYGKHNAAARVPYPVVASFCDVGMLAHVSEVCRAAYRCVESVGGCGR